MKKFLDISFKIVTYVAALFSIVALLAICFSIFKEGKDIFSHYGLFKFLFGSAWHPTHEPASYGIFPLIMGSITVTIGALIIALPLGVGSAVYISEIAGPRMKEILKPIIELLAGIPSVIYGLFGMAFLAPFIRQLFDIPTGLNMLTSSIILGIMVVPIISSMTEDALSSVPNSLREASYGLGANQWETIVRVIVPAAKSGIIASVILGFGRAIGETMVVLMVSGGAAAIPKSIFSPVRPMTSAVAAEMGETYMGSMHFKALFGIAIVLFVMTFATNMIMEWFAHKREI
jgi:phosphate transport system permease protein